MVLLFIGENMIKVNTNILNKYSGRKVKVYSNKPICDGCECFSCTDDTNEYFVKTTTLNHIRHDGGRFYYTTEDLSKICDFYPAHLLPVIGAFVHGKKHKVSNKFVTDISGLPAFNVGVANEDATINEYRVYLTLFNDFTVEQCQYERHALFDMKIMSSKFDLESKIQNSNLLKSKDFTAINVARSDHESVMIGYVMKESDNGLYESEYGRIIIDMNNKVSIKWH